MDNSQIAQQIAASRKIWNRHDLAMRLKTMGVEIAYDIRSNRICLVDGEPLTSLEIDTILDNSRNGKGPQLPSMRTDVGKSIWSAYMYETSFDPFEDYLNECYDQGEYLDPAYIPETLWKGRILDPDVRLVRWSWRAMFQAVVLRCMEAPKRWDIVPIIAGQQGCGKSTVVTNLLPPEWTNGGLPLKGVSNFDDSRKIAEFVEGKVILESSEMVGLTRSNIETVKAFISKHTDRSTRKYAIQAEDVPRKWIIIGTTNQHKPIPYDPTGGRRFIITKIGTAKETNVGGIVQWLEEHRHKFWGWTMSQYQEGLITEASLALPQSLYKDHQSQIDRYQWTN